MENIKRNIKLFWVSHGGPIKIAILIIVGVILVLRGLDQLAIENEKKKELNKKEQIIEENKEIKSDNIVIDEFIKHCKRGNVDNAYELLSQNCKDEKFPTLEDFQEDYYNKIFLKVYKKGNYYKTFNKELDIVVEYDYLSKLYKVIFYENILETGKLDNKNSIIDYYKVESEFSNKKVYIYGQTQN